MKTGLFSLILGVFLSGCGAEPMSSTMEGVGQPVKMYRKPHTKIVPECDVHAVMTIENDQIRVENKLIGSCEIAINPDPRIYNIIEAHTDLCGTTTFQAVAADIVMMTVDFEPASTWTSATLVDHQQRVCKDVVPAPFILEEAKGTKIHTLYSQY